MTFHSLEELLAKSDIVSIHVPHIPGENDQMINEGFLAQMKKGSILINTARGELQDNEAILRALKSNHLAGFATDVFANETEVFPILQAMGDDSRPCYPAISRNVP